MSYYYADHIIKQLKNAPQLIVFGAGNVASLVIECLQSEFYSFTIEYCMVSDMEGNPEQVKGVPVIDFEAASELVHRDSIILIAIVETYLGAVMDRLREHGYKNLLPLTFENDLWSMLRGNVYRSERLSQNKSVMLEAVQMFSPDYMDTVRRMQRGQFYYAYNMFIMRREILEDYCKWLFPILFYCEDHCEERCREKRNAYQSRYIGFLAEHLMSVYFIQHENEYKIVHARKHFIL